MTTELELIKSRKPNYCSAGEMLCFPMLFNSPSVIKALPTLGHTVVISANIKSFCYYFEFILSYFTHPQRFSVLLLSPPHKKIYGLLCRNTICVFIFFVFLLAWKCDESVNNAGQIRRLNRKL